MSLQNNNVVWLECVNGRYLLNVLPQENICYEYYYSVKILNFYSIDIFFFTSNTLD